MTDFTPPRTTATWLLRISPAFEGVLEDLLTAAGCRSLKRLGREFHLVRTDRPEGFRGESADPFLGWRMPVDHSWPCVPEETPGFVEKAAQAMWKKFGSAAVQSVVVGTLDPSGPRGYHKRLASNLRGRALQVFGGDLVRDAEAQAPESPTLFALVGREGLYCGLSTPRDAGGYHAGGFKFIRQSGEDHVSRAGAKIAEALHYLTLHRPLPETGTHWLELGACPGGMTSELLARGYRVTAVDRAPPDARLLKAAGLRVAVCDVADYHPPFGTRYGALLSDMNGDPAVSMALMTRFAPMLQPGSIIVFTLKLPQTGDFPSMLRSLEQCRRMACDTGLEPAAETHLGYNRHELTLLLTKRRAADDGPDQPRI